MKAALFPDGFRTDQTINGQIFQSLGAGPFPKSNSFSSAWIYRILPAVCRTASSFLRAKEVWLTISISVRNGGCSSGITESEG